MKRILLLLAFLLLPIYTSAAVIPVPAGTPLEPLFRAARPGDEFILADGRYSNFYFSARPGPVKVRAEHPGMAVISGSTVARPDTVGYSTSPDWTWEDLVVEGAAKAGFKIGSSDRTIVRRCTVRQCGVQGVQAGTSSFVTVEDCDIYQIDAEHCVYLSGAIQGCVIRNNRMSQAGKSGAQINSQGAGGVARDCQIVNNSIWRCGLKLQAAAINLIGIVNSVIAGNTINGCLAGGISLSANGSVGGASTGNAVDGNAVSFRYGEGRNCVTSNSGTNTVSGNRFWTGKPTVAAISATNGATLVTVNNVVLDPLPPAVLAVPDAGTGGATIAPVP